jgi:hypothetical protein
MAHKNSPPTLFQRSKQSAINAYQKTKAYIQQKWQLLEPKFRGWTRISKAATTATSTMKFSFDTLPILGTVLTVVAAIPLFDFLVPSFLYSPFFYYPVIIGLSAFFGYMKYQEMFERAQLDTKITENEKINEKLAKTITMLEKSLKQTQHTLTNLEKKCAQTSRILLPLKQARAVACKKSTANEAMPRRSERLRAKTA